MIFADINAHDNARDETCNSNARGEYLVNAVVDANGPFISDSEQPTR